MKARPVKSVRCAIYTRVSTEQGLVFSGEKLDMHCPGRLGAGAFFVGHVIARRHGARALFSQWWCW